MANPRLSAFLLAAGWYTVHPHATKKELNIVQLELPPPYPVKICPEICQLAWRLSACLVRSCPCRSTVSSRSPATALRATKFPPRVDKVSEGVPTKIAKIDSEIRFQEEYSLPIFWYLEFPGSPQWKIWKINLCSWKAGLSSIYPYDCP